MNKRVLGSILEDMACGILEKEGFTIVCKNYRAGKVGEIDIIACENEYICFIEVKGRRGTGFGHPIEAVGYGKIRKIRQVSKIYMTKKRLHGRNIRYDIVEIFYIMRNGKPWMNKCNIVRNAF